MGKLKLLLFDLDGTLVTTGGAGLKALARTFKDLYGIVDVLETINPSGKTDPAIFREIIQLYFGRDMDDDERVRIGETYLSHLQGHIEANPSTRPLPGVQEFVEHTSARSDLVIGLGTGNLERGARIKLSPTQLNKLLPFGGFGSDAEDRSQVLLHGHRRAESHAGQTILKDHVYVIGDTPLDIAAARRAGFRAVAVASGHVSFDQLKGTNPDYALRDMTEAFQFLASIADAAEAV